MKILLIAPEFPPHHTGGGGVVFENLAKTYKKLGHDVLVISGDYTQKNIFKPLSIREEQGIDIIRVPEFYTPISLLNTVMPVPFWYTKKLKAIIQSYNPEFVHIHGYGLFMPAQLARICRRNKFPYLFTIHGAPVSPEKMKNPIISLAYKFYHKFYGFPALNGAKRLTAVSSYARDFKVFAPWKEKIEIIGNGINPDEYKDPGYNIYEQRGIKKNKDTKIILSLGRIEWWKGFQKIVELMPEIIEKGYDVIYCIAGRDNGYKEILMNLSESLGVDNRIVYFEFLSGEDKMSALFHCDILAIPSIDGETFGMVALEGRIANRRILTTFFGGLKESLDGYENAYDIGNGYNGLFSIIDDSILNYHLNELYYWRTVSERYLL